MNRKIKCIDNSERENYLTLNKIYTVLDTNKDCFFIIDDKNEIGSFFFNRFEPVIETVNYKVIVYVHNKTIEKHIQADFVYTTKDTYQFYKNNNLIFVCPINSTCIEILDKTEKYK